MKRRNLEMGLHYGLPARSWVSLANNFNHIKTLYACINLELPQFTLITRITHGLPRNILNTRWNIQASRCPT
jgi:hypothetical protein